MKYIGKYLRHFHLLKVDFLILFRKPLNVFSQTSIDKFFLVIPSISTTSLELLP